MAQVVKIKQTELPKSGTTWSFGPDYMRGISQKSASRLCGMCPLPQMGHGRIVATKSDGIDGPSFQIFRLELQNIAGAFFLACNSVKVADWPTVFNVEIVEPK